MENTNMNYLDKKLKEIYNNTKNKGSVKFTYKGEKFKTFIDWGKDFCLTHYSNKYYSNGQNSWLVGCDKGLKIQLNELINNREFLKLKYSI